MPDYRFGDLVWLLSAQAEPVLCTVIQQSEGEHGQPGDMVELKQVGAARVCTARITEVRRVYMITPTISPMCGMIYMCSYNMEKGMRK